MMNLALQFQHWSLAYLKSAITHWHGRFVLMGLAMGLVYLQAWLPGLVVRAAQGSAGLPLIGATVALGLSQLWTNRKAIAQLQASEADQVTGHLLILCSVLAFPFCRFAVWPQAILWLLILAGIAISSWGIQFFARYPLPTLLMIITAYPKPGIFARTVWQALTPYKFLEQIMAQAGAAALRAIGQPAVSEGSLLAIPPAGAVDVDWGCNGFNMAFTMAAAGLIMGLFYKQRWYATLAIMAVGTVLALIFNVPRIMLLAIASIHWGEESFNFWHGHWGGQIFSTVLFTVFYYAVMALINRTPKKRNQSA
jgi:exosortase/archaeosortase family protein